MNIATFDNRHYPKMCEVWSSYGWEPCPLDALPRIGLVAEVSGEFVAYMGLYCSNDNIGQIGWPLADKQRGERKKALEMLFSELCKIATRNKCNYIYSVASSKKWGSTLMSYGMSIAEKDMVSYVLPLGENKDIAFICE